MLTMLTRSHLKILGKGKMDHSAEDHTPKPLSKNATRIEHEMEEGRLAAGHSASKTVHDEVYKLRRLDSSHGKLNQQAYHTDLAAIDHKLHANGYLPHMHILSHGRHAGELANEKHHGHAHQGNDTGQLQAHHRAPSAKEHTDNSDQPSARASHKAQPKGHVPAEAQASVAPAAPQERRTRAPRGAGARAARPNEPTTEREVPEAPTRVAAADTLPDSDAPPREVPQGWESRPPAPATSTLGGANYDQLKSAIQRAKAGGAPVSVLQYGDSHIAASHEAQEIKDNLAQLAPDRYTTKARVGTSADYPTRKENTTSWLDRPISAVKPDLVIVSYGSNDGDMSWGKESYKKIYDNLVSNIKQRAPNATLLLVGPTDRYRPKNLSLDTVIQAQKEVAAKYGADYYDIRQAMGGAGSIDALRKQRLAEPDRWHLTAPGYQVVGDMITRHVEERLK